VIAAAAALAAAAVVAAAPAPPRIGINYDWDAVAGCTLAGGVVSDPTPVLIRQQLAAMRAAGVDVLRTFVWNMHDAGGQTWGVISSAGGTLPVVARSNLISYLEDVRAAGFKELEVVFGPEWTNDPIGFDVNRWDPTMFDENWSLIKTVRPLVKRYGPPVTRFDLLNEGAPADNYPTLAQVEDYDARIYANYVDAFGNDDVTISSIVAWNDQSRLANLIDALRSTGRPLPKWFEVHSYGPTLLADLRAVDATMTAKGLTQPISLGETSYDNPDGAADIATYVSSTTRPLLEVMPWPLRVGSTCTVPAPYRDDALYSGLGEAPPPLSFSVTVGAKGAVTGRTALGEPLIALTAGTYAVSVTNRSKRDVRVAGHRVRPGRSTWAQRLAPGTYHYGSRTLTVLHAG
jgi:hypothetical protein